MELLLLPLIWYILKIILILLLIILVFKTLNISLWKVILGIIFIYALINMIIDFS